MPTVVVSGSFDNLRVPHIRLLQEASRLAQTDRLGGLHVLLWSDEVAEAIDGQPPKFPLAERVYFLENVRFVNKVTPIAELVDPDALPLLHEADLLDEAGPNVWVIPAAEDTPAKRAYAAAHDLDLRALTEDDLAGFPLDIPADATESASDRKKVVVTGCFDWLHSGHVRFFEETSELGDLYVVAGSDANVRLLKGERHPLFPEEERQYMVQAIRFVKQALISSGSGWMDAEPEIARIKPDMYAVNEDGDKPDKQQFCEEHGLEYVVLKRAPKEGLPKRESTALRGF